MENSVVLSLSDSSWEQFCSQWQSECEEFDEDFSYFAEGTFSVLKDLIKTPEKQAAVVAFKSDDGFSAVCQINTTLIKGYTEPVLRVRHLTLAPKYDFGDTPLNTYATVLVDAFFGVFEVARLHPQLKSQQLNFHLRSPADQQFFAALGSNLNQHDAFKSVQTKGAWLYVTLS